jgi:hypothetical protein
MISIKGYNSSMLGVVEFCVRTARQLLVVLRQDSGPSCGSTPRAFNPVRARSDLPDLLCIYICTLEACPVVIAGKGNLCRDHQKIAMCTSVFDEALLIACSSVDDAPLLLPLGVRRLLEGLSKWLRMSQSSESIVRATRSMADAQTGYIDDCRRRKTDTAISDLMQTLEMRLSNGI